jgi:hypothetical protein
MTIMHRRTFFAKVGQAGPLVAYFQEAAVQMKAHGIGWETRIYTDYYSGRSDRVVLEWVLESIGDMDSELNRVMEIPEAGAFFQGWLTKLNDMIHYADGENWTQV